MQTGHGTAAAAPGTVAAPAGPDETETAQRRLRIFLRVCSLVMLMAVIAVFMPRGWMDWSHRRLGLGPIPEGPVFEYLARSCSVLYALLGGELWLLSTDIRRFRPLILFHALTGLAFGFIIVAIDWHVGLPVYWTGAEGLSVGGLSLGMLLLLRGCPACRE